MCTIVPLRWLVSKETGNGHRHGVGVETIQIHLVETAGIGDQVASKMRTRLYDTFVDDERVSLSKNPYIHIQNPS